MCNEFLDEADRRMFETMKKERPARYRVAGLGEWGHESGLVYENYEIREFSPTDILRRPGTKAIFGLDFGYTNDPSALFCGIFDPATREIYVFDEIYERSLTNDRLARLIIERGYKKERICADAAEPKSISELRERYRIVPSRKGRTTFQV